MLGIDPGVSRCGYGVVRRDAGRFEAVAYGVIRTPPRDELPARLATLLRELDALMVEFPPAAVAVERVLFQVNTRTAMSVGQASGLALALAGRAGVPVAHYSPNEVKLAVAGDGTAGKYEVQTMVTRLLRWPRSPIRPTPPTRSRWRCATGGARRWLPPAPAPCRNGEAAARRRRPSSTPRSRRRLSKEGAR